MCYLPRSRTAIPCQTSRLPPQTILELQVQEDRGAWICVPIHTHLSSWEMLYSLVWICARQNCNVVPWNMCWHNSISHISSRSLMRCWNLLPIIFVVELIVSCVVLGNLGVFPSRSSAHLSEKLWSTQFQGTSFTMSAAITAAIGGAVMMGVAMRTQGYQMKNGSPTTEYNKALVRRLYSEVWNEKDLQKVCFVADTAGIYHSTVWQSTVHEHIKLQHFR